MPRSVGRVQTGYVVAFVAALLPVVAVVGLIQGCGKSSTTDTPKPSGKADVKSYLRDPVNKPEFEKAILGRSTREVTELLGPPEKVLRGDKSLGWTYRSERGASIVLMIDSDRVTSVDWGAA